MEDLDNYYKNKDGCDIEGVILFVVLAMFVGIITGLIG